MSNTLDLKIPKSNPINAIEINVYDIKVSSVEHHLTISVLALGHFFVFTLKPTFENF